MNKLFLILTFFMLTEVRAIEGIKLFNNTTTKVDVFGVCRNLTNSSATQFFIPSGTSGDWSNFLNHVPAGISPATCIYYEWIEAGFGACTGLSGHWILSGTGACTGAIADWSGYGACSVTCGGGTQSATCNWISSGTQNLSYTCITDTAGTQTMTYVCKDNNGIVVPASYCTGPQPVKTQSCTDTPEVICGTNSSPTSQSCTPGSPSCSGSGTQVCNTQACEPCPGFNACDPNAVCTSTTDGSGYSYGCRPASGKYCFNGIPVYDADYFDDCGGTSYIQSAVSCF